MCKNHNQNRHSHEESREILLRAADQYTYDCCPDAYSLDFARRVKSFDQIIGAYPVYNETTLDILQDFKARFASHRIIPTVRTAVREILDKTTKEEFTNNQMDKGLFNDLKEAIASQEKEIEAGNLPAEWKFQLIRKSSPKLSNLLLSLVKWYNDQYLPDYNKKPEEHDLIRQFNDRGSNRMNDFELVVSTEMHRIVGMSAFGKFTSCQDWIQKDADAEYHDYTHQSWANALDETCGIMFIRNKNHEEPTEDYPDMQDILARSLVRVMELENGQVVVYLHRIYAKSPYDKYLKDSILEWEKTLPANFHVIHMYKDSISDYRNIEKPNQHGTLIKGVTQKIHKQDKCAVYGGKKETCQTCEGEGSVRPECECCDGRGYYTIDDERECPVCDGSGEVEDEETEEMCECYECDGNGYVMEYDVEIECEECEGNGHLDLETCEECDGCGHVYDDGHEHHPYNDHSDWMSLNYNNGIRFQVPNYILQWDEYPSQTTTSVKKEEIKIGHMYKVKSISEPMSGFFIGDLVKVTKIDLHPAYPITIQKADVTGYCNVEHLEPLTSANTTFQIGDKVRVRPDAVVGERYNNITLNPSMVDKGLLTITRLLSDTIVDIDSGYFYGIDCLELVERPNQEVA